MTDERLTLRQAAARLGVSESAIRKRVERRTLRSEKGSDGRRYVYLDTGADNVTDTGVDMSTTRERNALISEMVEELRDEVHFLREQLHQELERRSAEAERYQQIVAALATANASLSERLQELEPPQQTTEASDTVEAEQELETEQARHEMAESTMREGMDEEAWRREEAERERDELRQELFALRRQRESPQTLEEEPQRAEPRPATGEAQEGTRRPWWRRVFGGS